MLMLKVRVCCITVTGGECAVLFTVWRNVDIFWCVYEPHLQHASSLGSIFANCSQLTAHRHTYTYTPGAILARLGCVLSHDRDYTVVSKTYQTVKIKAASFGRLLSLRAQSSESLENLRRTVAFYIYLHRTDMDSVG
jgi:hypothetical protein